MAKREIPEINAGSMADIAFLLLIFFLVTTTMDKDQALLRSIPKKIENPPPPPDVFKRNECAIRANNENQLMFRSEGYINDPQDISDKVIEFYRFNEGKPFRDNNYPAYTNTSRAEIVRHIDEIEQEMDFYDTQTNINEDVRKAKEDALKQWTDKLTALDFLGKKELWEVDPQAHVKIEVMKKTEYGLLTAIHSEVQEAIYTLRNDASMRLWNVPYATIVKKVDTDPVKNVEEKKMKMTLELLYNVKIIEVTPK